MILILQNVLNLVFKKDKQFLGIQFDIARWQFCKMTKHNLVQFNTEVYYQKCGYLYQSNVYTLFN